MAAHSRRCSGTSSSASVRSTCRRPISRPARWSPTRIRAHPWLAPEQTIITSYCGFNHLPRHIALGKMRAMGEAKASAERGLAKARVMSDRATRTGSSSIAACGEAQERFRVAQMAGGIGWFEWDLVTGAWEWTAPVAALFGFAADEPRPRFSDWEHAIFIDDVPKLLEAAKQAQQSGSSLRRIPGQPRRRQRSTGSPARARFRAVRRERRGGWPGSITRSPSARRLEARLLAVNETLEARIAQVRRRRGRSKSSTGRAASWRANSAWSGWCKP